MLTDVQTPFLGTPLVPLRVLARPGVALPSPAWPGRKGAQGRLQGLPVQLPGWPSVVHLALPFAARPGTRSLPSLLQEERHKSPSCL